VTGKESFDEIDISRLGRKCEYCYFLINITYAALFREMVSTEHRNLIKIILPVFEIIATLRFEIHLKGPFFGSWNIHIHPAPLYHGYTLECKIRIKAVQPFRR
jgi:hypothetical protein